MLCHSWCQFTAGLHCFSQWQRRPPTAANRNCVAMPHTGRRHVNTAARQISQWEAHRVAWMYGQRFCRRNHYRKQCILQQNTPLTDYYLKVKVKEGHTPKEHRRGAHLPFIGCWVHKWINHYCLWCMASATPDLRLPSQPKLVLTVPTHRGMARLSWPVWLVTYGDSLPTRRRSPIQALTGPSVE